MFLGVFNILLDSFRFSASIASFFFEKMILDDFWAVVFSSCFFAFFNLILFFLNFGEHQYFYLQPTCKNVLSV